MNKILRRLPFVALLLLLSTLVFSGTVLASPDLYSSHPTASGVDALTVSFPDKTYDKDNTTYAITSYAKGAGYGGPGWYEVKLFDGNRPEGSTISSVDLTIGYRSFLPSGDAEYKISYWVDPSATETVVKGPIQDMYSGNLTFTGISEPNDASWDWTDINSVRVRFTTTDGGKSDTGGMLYIHEIWLTITYTPVGLYVDPPTQTVTAAFSIDINVTNVNLLYGWEFKLYYNDTSILTATGVTEGTFFTGAGKSTYFNVIEIDDGYSATQGRVWATCTITGDTPGVNGTGTLATVSFSLDGAPGTSALDLRDTKLAGYYHDAKALFSVSHTAYDGTATVEAIPEFPLGFALEIALIPLIVYIVLRSRRKTKLPNSYPTSTKL